MDARIVCGVYQGWALQDVSSPNSVTKQTSESVDRSPNGRSLRQAGSMRGDQDSGKRLQQTQVRMCCTIMSRSSTS